MKVLNRFRLLGHKHHYDASLKKMQTANNGTSPKSLPLLYFLLPIVCIIVGCVPQVGDSSHPHDIKSERGPGNLLPLLYVSVLMFVEEAFSRGLTDCSAVTHPHTPQTVCSDTFLSGTFSAV